eukprot:TRINITY_DN1127_c0_g1_i1.p1 TRINITY_DN1127_c0_g1~~TRINITY_DN1127_c0_g1_i1.p1  ORF type:complete len:132 (+),score=31.06 TRINITY_DN1127_c0_g1_i1:98-493(+)
MITVHWLLLVATQAFLGLIMGQAGRWVSSEGSGFRGVLAAFAFMLAVDFPVLLICSSTIALKDEFLTWDSFYTLLLVATAGFALGLFADSINGVSIDMFSTKEKAEERIDKVMSLVDRKARNRMRARKSMM